VRHAFAARKPSQNAARSGAPFTAASGRPRISQSPPAHTQPAVGHDVDLRCERLIHAVRILAREQNHAPFAVGIRRGNHEPRRSPDACARNRKRLRGVNPKLGQEPRNHQLRARPHHHPAGRHSSCPKSPVPSRFQVSPVGGVSPQREAQTTGPPLRSQTPNPTATTACSAPTHRTPPPPPRSEEPPPEKFSHPQPSRSLGVWLSAHAIMPITRPMSPG